MSWRTIFLSVAAAATIGGLFWIAMINIGKHDTVFQLVVFLLLLIGFYFCFSPIKIDDE